MRLNSCPPANFWYLKISRANFDITWVFNTDIITRTGLKLTDFNSYDLEVGLELMKMLKLDESYVDEKITRDHAHDLTYDVIKYTLFFFYKNKVYKNGKSKNLMKN